MWKEKGEKKCTKENIEKRREKVAIFTIPSHPTFHPSLSVNRDKVAEPVVRVVLGLELLQFLDTPRLGTIDLLVSFPGIPDCVVHIDSGRASRLASVPNVCCLLGPLCCGGQERL